MCFILGHRRHPVFQRYERRDFCAVRESAASVLQPVMDPPECPHAFMKMRVEVAVEDHVADRSCQAAGTMQNVKSITFLRAECDGIQNRRDRVLCFQTPLVIVKVEHMGLRRPRNSLRYLHRCLRGRR